MSMCGICWFDGRALTDEIDDLRQRVKEAEAKSFVDRERFISVLITMRKALVLNGSRLTDDAINAYEELKLSSAETEVTNTERSYDDPAYGDTGDTPKTDALIEQWARSPTPVPPEFIGLCKKLERESYSKQETMAMLSENWTRTERLLAIALKENKALWEGIEAIREKQLEKPKCPVCDQTLIDGEWCASHGAINERLNPNDYRYIEEMRERLSSLQSECEERRKDAVNLTEKVIPNLRDRISKLEGSVNTLENECNQLNDLSIKQREIINNLSSMCRRLSYSAKRSGNDKLAHECVVLLKKYDLGGSVLRNMDGPAELCPEPAPGLEIDARGVLVKKDGKA